MLKKRPLNVVNLSLLRGRLNGYGVPTSAELSDFLKSNGASISKEKLSDFFTCRSLIGEAEARSIESACKVPDGWLAADHDFVFDLTPSESDSFLRFYKLEAADRKLVMDLIGRLLQE